MDSSVYYRLMNYPKSVLIKYILELEGENIDFKKIESLGWDRTSEKLERRIESMQRTNRSLAARGFDKKDPQFKKAEQKLKQKEFLLKWVQKKKNEHQDVDQLLDNIQD